jgi:hypothetical protein
MLRKVGYQTARGEIPGNKSSLVIIARSPQLTETTDFREVPDTENGASISL